MSPWHGAALSGGSDDHIRQSLLPFNQTRIAAHAIIRIHGTRLKLFQKCNWRFNQKWLTNANSLDLPRHTCAQPAVQEERQLREPAKKKLDLYLPCLQRTVCTAKTEQQARTKQLPASPQEEAPVSCAPSSLQSRTDSVQPFLRLAAEHRAHEHLVIHAESCRPPGLVRSTPSKRATRHSSFKFCPHSALGILMRATNMARPQLHSMRALEVLL